MRKSKYKDKAKLPFPIPTRIEIYRGDTLISMQDVRFERISTTVEQNIANGVPVIDLGPAWEKWCNGLK